MFSRLLRERLRWKGLLACGPFVFGVLIAFAQQPASQDQNRPIFRTEANYVRVDVYATTRDGSVIDNLRRDEFELLEDRVRQTIDQFTPIAITTGPAPTARKDPVTPETSRQAATESRARVFVLFLDVMHVDRTASQRIAKPLVDSLRSLIGPDDLIAIASPQMPVRTLTFTRQLDAVEAMLNRPWGARDGILDDAVEQRYASCYPGVPRRLGELVAPDQGIAQEMILRRREAQTLDALDELVGYLRDVREERKAVIVVTNGWRVYSPDATLTRAIDTALPTTPGAVFDPATGKLGTDRPGSGNRAGACDADRLRLGQLDHRTRFRQLLDRANRGNVSFYPVDPRGIVVFDDDIVPVAGVGQNPTVAGSEDARRLGERHTALRTMAEATDGVAVIETGNFAPALKRISLDLSAYYLLGYYSTGRLDGKFHEITVRVTRPGAQIRARRGYLAATNVLSAAPPAESSPAAAAETQAVTNALATLGSTAREPSIYIQAAAGWSAANAPFVATALEVPRGALAADWAKGGEADVLLIDPTGGTAGSGHATIAPGTGSARVTIVPRALTPGTYELRVRAKGANAVSASSDSVRLKRAWLAGWDRCDVVQTWTDHWKQREPNGRPALSAERYAPARGARVVVNNRGRCSPARSNWKGTRHSGHSDAHG